jgi:hypothetical protein
MDYPDQNIFLGKLSICKKVTEKSVCFKFPDQGSVGYMNRFSNNTKQGIFSKEHINIEQSIGNVNKKSNLSRILQNSKSQEIGKIETKSEYDGHISLKQPSIVPESIDKVMEGVLSSLKLNNNVHKPNYIGNEEQNKYKIKLNDQSNSKPLKLPLTPQGMLAKLT